LASRFPSIDLFSPFSIDSAEIHFLKLRWRWEVFDVIKALFYRLSLLWIALGLNLSFGWISIQLLADMHNKISVVVRQSSTFFFFFDIGCLTVTPHPLFTLTKFLFWRSALDLADLFCMAGG